MAQALIGHIEPYDIASSSWDSYLKRVDAYFVANDLTGNDKAAEAKHRAVFLSLIGGDAFRTLENLVSPNDPMATPLKMIREKLSAHFSAQLLEIAVTHSFYSRYQADGENASEYLATLRHMAKHCVSRSHASVTRSIRHRYAGLRNATKAAGHTESHARSSARRGNGAEKGEEAGPIASSHSASAAGGN